VSDEQRAIARRFGHEYFDGDRLTGYGGYHYHPRFWSATVRRLRDYYGLAPTAALLDVGCAKGFMLREFKGLMPELTLAGIDISSYAIEQADPSVRSCLRVGDAAELPWPDASFDLVISINTVHNLPPAQCRRALREIMRVSRGRAFITVDAWRDEAERKRMLKWNLTALTYMHVDQWKRLFEEIDYRGDYYWFIAQ